MQPTVRAREDRKTTWQASGYTHGPPRLSDGRRRICEERAYVFEFPDPRTRNWILRESCAFTRSVSHLAVQPAPKLHSAQSRRHVVPRLQPYCGRELSSD